MGEWEDYWAAVGVLRQEARRVMATQEDGKTPDMSRFTAAREAVHAAAPSEAIRVRPIREVCRLTGISAPTLRRWAGEGVIPAQTVGSRLWYVDMVAAELEAADRAVGTERGRPLRRPLRDWPPDDLGDGETPQVID
jgi:excisionase family DNA binding protein